MGTTAVKKRDRVAVLAGLCGGTVLALVAGILESTPAASAEYADTVLFNGNVLTVDSEFARTEAIAISGDKILAVGNNRAMEAYRNEQTRWLDLKGATVLPGMNDSHIHMDMWAYSLPQIDLRGKSMEEIQAEVRTRVKSLKPGEVLRGTGWSEATLGRLPTRDDIDTLTPAHPVLFQEMGHAFWVNSRMLDLAGIDDQTPEPEGVKFEREPDTGRLSGVLHEASELILPHVPPLSPATKRALLLDGMQRLVERGFTSVTIPGAEPGDISVLQSLAEDGQLKLRISVHPWTGRSLDASREMLAPYGGELAGRGTFTGLLNLRGVKIVMDGAPPGRTAFMFEDYPCCPGEHGILLMRGDTEAEQVAEASRSIAWFHRQGYQVGVHADGDRSAHIAIEALAEAMHQYPAGDGRPQDNVLRHYLIHGDLVADGDISRMAQWNIGLTTQPVITFEAGELLLDIWGRERGARHMATGLFLDAGVRTSISTDAPIVPPDWKQNIEYAVLRENKQSPGRTNGLDNYRTSVEEAIIAHTRTPAYQDFQEDVKGSLEPGRYADLVVIDRDITAIDPHEISETETLMTMVGGRIVHDGGGFSAARDAVVGVWVVEAADAPFPQHDFVFNADGTMQQANPDAGTALLSGSDGMGIWVRDGQTVKGKFVEIVADRSSREFESRGEISFEFAISGDHFRGTASASFFGPDGALVRGPMPTPLKGRRLVLN